MSQEFVQRITEGFDAGHYKVSLEDHVVVFCGGGFSVDGELLGFCPEGVLLGSGAAEVWVNSEAIIGVAKVNRPGGGHGGGHEEFVPPAKNGKIKPSVATGTEATNRVFSNENQ